MSASIRELLVTAQLGSDSPALDAQLLLAHCLGRERSYLLAWPEREVDPDTTARYLTLVARRRAGEPVAYLVGTREFWSLPLEVNASTLIPRPDTERLVELALALGGNVRRDVLDLGTGSGAIALALAHERPQWQVMATDFSGEALALAEHNRQRLGLGNVTLLCADWFDGVDEAARFDLIVSNPPYIDAADLHLEQGDVRFEPRSALVAANGGLADIDTIAAAAQRFLKAGGSLLVEHGWQQGAAVRAVFERLGYRDVSSWLDHGGRERITGGVLR